MLSLYIIGSVARESNDNISDKDLLAVGCPKYVEGEISRYLSDGWNITHFTRDKFQAMANSRSLFVQHVKQDGKPVRDDKGYLKSVLNCYNLSTDYTRQLSDAIKPIYSLGEIESGYWGRLFQADILYVSVRNACILHRATYSTPDFDFKSLIGWVGRIAGLTTDEEEHLLRLRSLKHGYRERKTDASVSEIADIAKTAMKLAKYWGSISNSGSHERTATNGYFDVRALEGQLVRAVGPVFMDSLEQGHVLSDLWGNIRSSDPYKPRIKSLSIWSRQVEEFLKNHAYH